MSAVGSACEFRIALTVGVFAIGAALGVDLDD
jgi:hypothetical protein